MSDFSLNFNALESNVLRLIERKKSIEQELKKVRLSESKLREELKIKEDEIERLNEKNKILRIAKGDGAGDKREIKLKINEIVREVDKCIAQLNQ